MSSKRLDLPDAPLCRFSFADGRRCALPAHPAHDGFCFASITALFAHVLVVASIFSGDSSTLAYLGFVLFQSDQMITENELRAGAGPG